VDVLRIYAQWAHAGGTAKRRSNGDEPGKAIRALSGSKQAPRSYEEILRELMRGE